MPIASIVRLKGVEKALSQITILFAVIDGPHRRSCVQKGGTSGQLGTERALQPSWVILNTVSESEVLHDHELLKLSSSNYKPPRLVLQSTYVTAVINPFAQLGKIIESS